MDHRERSLRTSPTQAGADGSRRVLPPDWPLALRAGAESVVFGWGIVALAALALYLAASSRDAAAALSLGEAVRTGTGIWSLGFGGAMGSVDGEYGMLSMPLPGLTLLQLWLTRSSVRRARLEGPASGMIAVGASALTAMLIVATSRPAASRTWIAVVGVSALTALVAWSTAQRNSSGWSTVASRYRRPPEWIGVALGLARELAVVLIVIAAAVALAGMIAGGDRVSRLHDVLAGGSLAATAGLALLQLGWLPTALVWALSWLVGPGFAVGAGSVFSPTRVVAGAVPTLPLLGGLPTAAVGDWAALLPFSIVIGAGAVTWRQRVQLHEMPLRHAAAVATTTALLVAFGVLAACLAASGQIGPGRMAEVGPRSGYVAVIVALMVLVGVGLVAVLPHPRTRVLTRRGVQATVAATSAAGHSARERFKTRLGQADKR
ncbi:DUF6350 family protein [Actinomyces sp.]|uniref:cell division protein PerM n=1 Tax=Actinomyces sp. TaxID=29317 RepID=UPI0026DBB67F|nr:DUF6350 family protein [Actinomyces sp.]MDO4899795.1 DUF6350 family protein [Actinomyces sp.]